MRIRKFDSKTPEISKLHQPFVHHYREELLKGFSMNALTPLNYRQQFLRILYLAKPGARGTTFASSIHGYLWKAKNNGPNQAQRSCHKNTGVL